MRKVFKELRSCMYKRAHKPVYIYLLARKYFKSDYDILIKMMISDLLKVNNV